MTMHRRALAIPLPAMVLLAALTLPARADNWPEWRGPKGDGHSAETEVPLKWSATENVRWRAPLRGKGASTPVVWGDKVFLTIQTGEGPQETLQGRVRRNRGGEGENRGEPGEGRRGGRGRGRGRGDSGESRNPEDPGNPPADPVSVLAEAADPSEGAAKAPPPSAPGVPAHDDADLEAGDPEVFDIHLFVQCFDVNTGNMLWEYEAPQAPIVPTHPKHNLASPSCSTDGERVYSWFGTGPVLCHSMTGELLWSRNLAAEFGPFIIKFGHGSSPALYKDSLILLCDHRDPSYILAVDKRTGKDLWKVDRSSTLRSYSTPFFIQYGGRDEMIVVTSNEVQGFDPANGTPLWSASGLQLVAIPMPVVSEGVVFANGGFANGPIMAVKLGGLGDVTKDNVVWRKKNGSTYTPSMIFAGDALFYAKDDGVGHCLDPKTGEVIWKERLGGNFSASPVAAAGRIYVVNEEGETFVFEAGRSFKLLAQNPLGETSLASIAIADGSVFIRTDQSLFRLGEAK